MRDEASSCGPQSVGHRQAVVVGQDRKAQPSYMTSPKLHGRLVPTLYLDLPVLVAQVINHLLHSCSYSFSRHTIVSRMAWPWVTSIWSMIAAAVKFAFSVFSQKSRIALGMSAQ